VTALLRKLPKPLFLFESGAFQPPFMVLQRFFNEFNGIPPTVRAMRLKKLTRRNTMNAVRPVILAMISGLALLSANADADEGFTMAVSIGSAKLGDDFDELNVDTDATSFRITAGWRFNEHFSIEGGYHDFGDFEQGVVIDGAPATVSLSADGFTVGVTGALPLSEKFALTGRMGLFFWNGTAEINAVSQATPEDSNLYVGAGLSYSLTDKFALTADWSRYDLEDTDSSVLSAGFRYRFGQ
jgi:OOP family OmpA-OmpF porin